jgi:hypothetical protein
MLQQERPGDYIIGTDVAHTVREPCEVAVRRVGLDWRELGWSATFEFDELVASMVDAAPG